MLDAVRTEQLVAASAVFSTVEAIESLVREHTAPTCLEAGSPKWRATCAVNDNFLTLDFTGVMYHLSIRGFSKHGRTVSFGIWAPGW